MSALRHKWIKVTTHNYVCRVCGTRKVNVVRGGGWVAEWHTPDGRVVELRLAPPCGVGAGTAARLAWLADWQARQPAAAAEAGA